MERIDTRSPVIGVVGRGKARRKLDELAAEVGREVASKGAVLVCGGFEGIMAEAARGAKEIGRTYARYSSRSGSGRTLTSSSIFRLPPIWDRRATQLSFRRRTY